MKLFDNLFRKKKIVDENLKNDDPEKSFHKASYCPHCGTEIPYGSLYCPNCGIKVITPEYTIEIKGANADEVNSVLAHYGELNKTKIQEAITAKAEMDILGDGWVKKRAADILKELVKSKTSIWDTNLENGYIFISYAHKDAESVTPLLEQFKKHGYRIWYDKSIEPASTWDDNIAEHIEQSAFFISLISKAYIESKNCLQELRYSLGQKDENRQFLIFMEPVQLPKGIAMRTGDVQNIMLYSYDSAEEMFAQLQKTNGITSCIDRIGQNKDMDDYGQALLISANLGNEDSQFELGRCYYDGIHVKQSYSQAVIWYKKAAEQGMAVAQHNLALCYESGIGVGANPAEAFRWYREAAIQGNTTAQNHLGLCYDMGIGTDTNQELAVHWYQKAADNGNAGAQFNLGISYRKGEGVEKNIEMAKKWLQMSADQGEERAKKALLAIALVENKEITVNQNGEVNISDSGESNSEEPTGDNIEVSKGKLA